MRCIIGMNSMGTLQVWLSLVQFGIGNQFNLVGNQLLVVELCYFHKYGSSNWLQNVGKWLPITKLGFSIMSHFGKVEILTSLTIISS